MPLRRVCAPGLVAIVAAALGAGCGLGPGEGTEGEASLTVTRDYGAKPMLEAEVESPSESETVMRLLDREAEIETRYGGGFVQAIGGVEGRFDADRSFDWFFFANGVESEVGAAEARVRGGDRIWWDHRDWTEAMRVPAVVGSWPEPFVQASATEREPVVVECAGERAPCRTVAGALGDAGVSSATEPLGSESPTNALRILVGPWPELRSDPAARLLERAPSASGVFARFAGGALALLDQSGDEAAAGEGLVAATRLGESQPTWVVTGVDAAGVEAAAELVGEEDLEDRYAVASARGEPVALPAPGEPG